MDIFFVLSDFYGPCRIWARPEFLPGLDLSKKQRNKGTWLFSFFPILYSSPHKGKYMNISLLLFFLKAYQISSQLLEGNHQGVGKDYSGIT